MYESEKGNITMSLAGDCLIHRSLSCYREKKFLDLVEILRKADVTCANLEGPVHEYESPPNVKATGLYFIAIHPRQLEDLKWAGIDIVSCCNNHGLDYGERGLLTTLNHLNRLGISHAGTGRNLREARAPGYLETPAGRVALIATTSQYTNESDRASERGPQTDGKPGMSCLSFGTDYIVEAQDMETLRVIGGHLGLEPEKARRRKYLGGEPEDTKDLYHFLGKRFLLGKEPAIRSHCNPRDEADILKWVEHASKQAEWVIISHHSHAYDMHYDQPPAFQIEFAHACIDAGAHCFMGHGPHFLWGMEIYRNRPIFYSLGNFILQLQNIPFLPRQMYDTVNLGFDATPSDFQETFTAHGTIHHPADPIYSRTIVPVCRWERHELKEVQLWPVELGYGKHWGAAGRPMLAEPPVSDEIIRYMQEHSEPMGCHIEAEKGIGIVRPGS